LVRLLHIASLKFLLELEEFNADAFLHSLLVLLQSVYPHAQLGYAAVLRFVLGITGKVVGTRRTCFLLCCDQVFVAIELYFLRRHHLADGGSDWLGVFLVALTFFEEALVDLDLVLVFNEK
jgi:hypothetical protein